MGIIRMDSEDLQEMEHDLYRANDRAARYKVELERVNDRAARYRVELERLRAQLPKEMQDCTIQFKECENGHGRLMATNWIDHGCDTCKIATLVDVLEAVRTAINTSALIPQLGYSDEIECLRIIAQALTKVS